ncbi:hypothetical protein FEE95_18970 [Maribacter algarum]|uniref:Four helix bundle protein n=1 Tax=Maribacter algarum (ex Zhang et al. 2020) TaxID=2578118 RepID=A0A5S3PGA2_9FLAO|nr:hypothetical protein [Maribacter algarum]TMM53153.1 hypothetical protein FEE95_18970 [Maribacter algarum]
MSSENFGAVKVYQKAESLYELSRHLVSYVSFNKDLVKLYQSNSLRDIIANSLLTDARLISKNMAQALSSKSYSERLRNATFINIMIRNINSYCTGLEKDGVKEKEYLNLLRSEIKSFRKSYLKWIRTLPNSSDDSPS